MNIRIVFVLISLFLLSSCSSSEKEARTLFNQAIKDWSIGNITEAEEKFNIIETQYLDTIVATESIKQRALLKEKYKREFDAGKWTPSYQDLYSKKVISSINNYFLKNGNYPENITLIDIDEIKHLSLCEYDKALFEYGYKINCSQAESAINEDKKKVRIARNKERAEKRAQRNSNNQNIKKTIKDLTDFPLANSTWGATLNKSMNVPEDNSFKAYYFNTNTPNHVIHKEIVSDISINYSYDKFHGIKSGDFGGYWVGKIHLERDAVKTIAINQGWSKTRLIIDGHIVHESGSKNEFLINLKKGSHLIEVEYVNNWHTTEFSLAILDKLTKLSYTEIKKTLAASIKGQYQVHSAGLYESSSKDLSTILNIGKSREPIVLFLSSYSSVKWQISNPFRTKIHAIVYGSYSPGTTVSGDLDDSTLLLFSKKRIGSYKSSYKCSCNGGRSHCEGGSMLSTKRALEDLTKQKMTGFSGKYSASQLDVPQLVVNEAFIKQQEQYEEEAARVRSSCSKKNNPNFEEMFKP